MIQLIHGDCLNKMSTISDGSVDMVMVDVPYGTTACKWDSVIPLEPMWKQLKRVIKPNGAIVMTASQPFTTILIASNMKMFKYCWVWEKSRPTGFLNAKKRPLKITEDVCVFGGKSYNPQGLIHVNRDMKNSKAKIDGGGHVGIIKNVTYRQEWTNYPVNILHIGLDEGNKIHPTQKPVALMEYLIKTYTNKSETVLDFAMGSGTTGVACRNVNRNFIGIELDDKYFEIAQKRIIPQRPRLNKENTQ